MKIYRNISTTFWSDSLVDDKFEPMEKFVFLYLLSNPHTNLAGCYEIGLKQMAYETGLSKENIKEILSALDHDYEVIAYDYATQEVLIFNWYKYNWTKSEKFKAALMKEIEAIKSDVFKEYVRSLAVDGKKIRIRQSDSTADTVSEKENNDGYGIKNTIYISNTDTVSDTVSDSVTVTDTDTVSVTDEEDTDTELRERIKEIVDYFNEVTGKHYTYTGKDTVKNIKARLKDGFTVDDFKTVIWKKTQQWKGTDMEQYIRPVTLFGNKFESYLNQSTPQTRKDELDEWLMQDTERDVFCDGDLVIEGVFVTDG